ncbi:aminoacyl-tRNA hydrolase [Alicyclobacillus mali]|uniref:Peptidyl-tRNA hydrolase n=1 Tax=Alicyclobacillus mali (ex Roth et al. 2021) TaxID=1123961 RepID=A0ABS0F006_9BACL|nr:aminoacyl-tRNA hydrolase [Alicyclobacillus mali (ex Roth et al. 2021)]MBF8376620.1 aminoacyl-tRNA hydrolase [Alicyclobacillus mali (ex Roth et al. 2021)]MCL6489154.1 aminoacyl-tRNA hydrolase [Alicyclobacillus mali (ex Roth et al. 2021)]
MKVIVGLGNPGREYERTRHNAGFMAIDILAEKLAARVDQADFHALVGDARHAGEKVLLVKPHTYMNVSGLCVGEIVRYYRVDPAQDLMVLYDDMDFPPGVVRLKAQGSAGGHNGIKSIIDSLGTEKFGRVRIGIGRPPKGAPIVPYVLGAFSREEEPHVRQALETAAEAALFAVERGFAEAMTRYNAAARA